MGDERELPTGAALGIVSAAALAIHPLWPQAGLTGLCLALAIAGCATAKTLWRLA